MRKQKWIIGVLLATLILQSISPAVTYGAENRNYQNTAIVDDLATDVTVEGTSSFGNLLAKAMDTKISEQEENQGYNIFSAEIEGNVAQVSFEALGNSELVVGIYEEDGIKMLSSGSVEVTAEETEAVVTIETESMPQYFYLRCFLIDSENFRPLCVAYESPNYTQEMQEFLSKTTEDFEEERVLNLDSDTTNNFAVYDEDTKVIPQSEDTNEVVTADDEKNVYVIEHADENVTSLQAGDIFAYEYGEMEILIVKVADLWVDTADSSNTIVTITGEDLSMDEVFEYVKLDGTVDTADAEVDATDLEEGIIYEGMVEYNEEEIMPFALEGEGKQSIALSYKFVEKKLGSDDNYVKLSGGVEVKLEGSLKFYLSMKYQYLELKLDYSGKISISLEGKVKGEIPLATVKFSPVVGVDIEITPSFVVETSAKIDISGKLTGTVGFEVSNDVGVKNLTTSPKLKAEVKGEITVFLGFSLEPEIKIIHDKVAKAELSAKVGGEIKGKEYVFKTSSSSQKHECKKCIDGDISAKTEVEFKAKLLNMEKLQWTYKKELAIKLCDFYYSFDYKEFAFTSCPHLSYRVTVTVKEQDGKPVSGATVNDSYTTAEDGTVSFYLPNGEYTISTDLNDEVKTKKITVKDNAKSVVIYIQNSILPANALLEVSLGDEHSGVVTKDGSLYMWGDNSFGQLGNGTMEDSSNVPVKILDNVRSVSLDFGRSGAITKDGSLYMWGYNECGELGNGTIASSSKPIKVLENVESVSLSSSFSGAITRDGSLYMWGNNEYGQLGTGTTENRSRPVKVLDNVASVSLSQFHSGAITKDGSLYMWGHNEYGELGNGTTKNSSKPVKVLENVESVSLDMYYSGAITKDGNLYTWGYNINGELGNGTTENSVVPKKVLENIESVCLDYGCSRAIKKDGSLYMWGANWFGQLGTGTTGNSSVPVKILENVKGVSAGAFYSNGAITKSGDLYTWGNNEYGQLGNGTAENGNVPVKVLENVKSVSLGMDHGGAITKEGNLYMWGTNWLGQLGNGTNTDSFKPVKIEFPNTKASTVSVLSTGSLPFATQNNFYSTEWNTHAIAALSSVQPNIAVDETRLSRKEAMYTDLLADEIYNFYIMRETEGEHIFDTENLFYLGQGVSDKDGTLNIVYEPIEETAEAQILLVGRGIDISEADVQMLLTTVNGKDLFVTPTVSYHNTKLTEGVDYELEGDYLVTVGDIGTYTLFIRGIGDYTGIREVTYQLFCEHKYDSGKVTKEATCTNTGEAIYTCQICGESETRVTPAKGHTYEKAWTIDKKATCKEVGSMSHHCSVCGEKTDITVIKKTAHTYAKATVKKRATTSKNGSSVQTCTVCGKQTSTSIAKIKKIQLSATSYVYNGKIKKPSVTIKDSAGKKLKNKTDYTVTYSKGRKNVGKYTVTIKFKGKYSGTVKRTFTIVPKNTSISKVNAKSKGFEVKWKKQTKQTTGYQIQYSTSSKFTKKTSKVKTVGKNKTASKSITKLKPKKKYYVRVRTYKTVKINGKSTKLYSNWSKVKKITTKK